MISGTLDDQYFEWLYGQIGVVKNRNPARSHWELARKLYVTPFIWHVRNDDNRAEDGKYLRHEFVNNFDLTDVDRNWMELECSVLEMLIGLARIASFETDEEAYIWFWRFLENLELKEYTDNRWNEITEEHVDEILDRFVNRKYDRNGVGGLFPLRHSRRDQRKVELWYQLSAYLLEGHYVDVGA